MLSCTHGGRSAEEGHMFSCMGEPHKRQAAAYEAGTRENVPLPIVVVQNEEQQKEAYE